MNLIREYRWHLHALEEVALSVRHMCFVEFLSMKWTADGVFICSFCSNFLTEHLLQFMRLHIMVLS